VIDGEICFVEILDTAGQEEYTALREQWIRESEGAVIVYSISSRESFVRVPIFHAQVLRVKDDAQFPLFIVGNKSDRVTEREVSTQEGFMLSKELGCEFAESSAKNCENVEESFYDVVRQIRKRRLETLPSKEFNDLKSPETTAPVIARSPRSRQKALETIRSAFGRSKIHIPADEAKTEAGRLRLTRRLIDAARGNQEREVRAYLAAGAHLDGQPGADGAAIHAASASGHVNIVNLLLRKGAAVNAEGPSGVSPLQLAAAEGHSSIVRLLLHKGARIEQSSTLHGTALCAAVSRARFEVVHILLERGANVNSVGGPYGNALQAAAWVGNVAIVEALHRNGAKINARGEGNCTALQVASFAGNAGAVRSLLVRGAQVNAFGGKYGLAMEAANAGGHFEVIKLLLEHGASFETIQISPITTSLVREGIEPAAQTYIEPDKDCSFSPGSTLDLSLSLQRQISAPISPEKGATSNCPQPEISDLGFSTISNPSNAEIE
jgi:GTPase KRas protein